ncbi:hypothetical protein Ahu01nite_079260 [Winogradskya humida]|uniref:Uncharacterized protein n=1 Tax=Winogradskya humida TaxID=113566 RepID=A0ABQ4A1T7_9ACTN|nr:hypothetical protein Ahu01nite_079260 [Actinoplanes humidus]
MTSTPSKPVCDSSSITPAFLLAAKQSLCGRGQSDARRGRPEWGQGTVPAGQGRRQAPPATTPHLNPVQISHRGGVGAARRHCARGAGWLDPGCARPGRIVPSPPGGTRIAARRRD